MSVASEHRVTAPPAIAVRLAWGRYLDKTRAAMAEACELVEQLARQRLTGLQELGPPVPVAAERP